MEEQDLMSHAKLQAQVDVLQSLLQTVILMLPDRAMFSIQNQYRRQMEFQEKLGTDGTDIDKEYAAQFYEIVSKLSNNINSALEERKAGDTIRLINGPRIPKWFLEASNP